MAFTSITGGTDWQDIDFINELVGAQRERADAAGITVPSLASAGDDIQAVTFWTALQNWLESNCVYFANHLYTGDKGLGYFDGIEGAVDTYSSAIPPAVKFTAATWRTAAGIHASGFRRAAAWVPATDDWTDNTDAMFGTTGDHDGGYGVMQAGDIIGPWIFDDIQKGMHALKWTWHGTGNDGSLGTTVYDEELWSDTVIEQADCATALANYDWSSDSWTELETTNYVYVAIGGLYDTDDGWVCGAERRVGRARNTPETTALSAAVDVYLVPYWTVGGTDFVDTDGKGMEHDTLWYFASGGSSDAATRTTIQMAKNNTDPIDDLSITCPDGADETGVAVFEHIWIYKWTFTYTL